MFGKQYEEAGFPTLSSILSQIQLKRVTFIWTTATVVSAMMIPLFGIINYNATIIVLAVSSAVVLYYTLRFVIAEDSRKNTVNMFIKINFYSLLLIILLSADKLIKILNT